MFDWDKLLDFGDEYDKIGTCEICERENVKLKQGLGNLFRCCICDDDAADSFMNDD